MDSRYRTFCSSILLAGCWLPELVLTLLRVGLFTRGGRRVYR